MSQPLTRVVLVAGVLLGACTAEQPSSGPGPALTGEDAYGVSGLRRLSKAEVLASVDDVFGVDGDDLAAKLPDDIAGTTPFDNDYREQTVSSLVIGNYSTFAAAYAAKVATVPDLAQRLGGCTPAAADDRACFDKVASAVGRRLFRRPLTTEQLDAYAAVMLPEARTAGQFSTAIEMLALLLVQHPSFLYRLEQDGDLDGYQIATRMSFLLWGSVPDDELLDKADDLRDVSTRQAQARRMLDDPRAKRMLHRFHALWLGFSDAPLPAAIAGDLRDETNHLIDRVVFEKDADWLSLLSWPETYVTPALAQQYGLPAMSAPGWVTYPAGRGGGVLSHGSFLSLGAKFGDTSPTVRGAEIYKRLACGDLGPIPSSIDTDLPPGQPTDCKPVRYSMRDTPGCDSCHAIVDNIGFGLENFGVFGTWRTVEPNNPQCTIDGAGSMNGQMFSGPAQLGPMLAADSRVSACATRQLFRFMTGREDDAGDEATLATLDSRYRNQRSLKSLLVDLVAAPAFAYRKGE
jgi:hypothetical protein